MQRLLEWLCGTILSQRKTFQRVLDEKSMTLGATLVVLPGCLAGITDLVSYLYGASITMEEVRAGTLLTEPLTHHSG
jgi:hypothetical protein